MLLDASAVLAFLQGETGGGRIGELLPGASLTSVNASEVVSKLRQAGVGLPEPFDVIQGYGFEVLPFEVEDVGHCAELHASYRKQGLSMADCCCLAAARRRRLDVLTADRRWAELNLDIRIELIR